MALHIYKCRTPGCAEEFQSIDGLLDHVQRYQSEITLLVLKLQNLLRHQGLKDDTDFQGDADLSDTHEKGDNGVSRKRRRLNLPENPVWHCPKCRSKSKTFTKHFDLLRHYAQRHFGYDGTCDACNVRINGGRLFWDHKCDRELTTEEQEKYVEQRKSFREDVAVAIGLAAEEPKPTNLDQMDEILELIEGADDVQVPSNIDENSGQSTPPIRETESDERTGHVQDPSNSVDPNLQQSLFARQARNPNNTLPTARGLYTQSVSQNHELEGHDEPNISLILQQSLYDRHIQYQSKVQPNQPRNLYDQSRSQRCEFQLGEGTGDVQGPRSIDPILLQPLYDRQTRYPFNVQANPPRALYDKRAPGLERTGLVQVQTNVQ